MEEEFNMSYQEMSPLNKEAAAKALVTLTPEAESFVKQIITQTPSACGLRIGVKKSGCSGFGYVIECAQEIKETDTVYLSGDVTVVIDANSLPYLKGMSIECVTEGLNKVLKFVNPNATGACGCGESFSVELDEK